MTDPMRARGQQLDQDLQTRYRGLVEAVADLVEGMELLLDGLIWNDRGD